MKYKITFGACFTLTMSFKLSFRMVCYILIQLHFRGQIIQAMRMGFFRNEMDRYPLHHPGKLNILSQEIRTREDDLEIAKIKHYFLSSLWLMDLGLNRTVIELTCLSMLTPGEEEVAAGARMLWSQALETSRR